MVYQIIIANNSVGKRKVGRIISQAENQGLELCEIRKRTTRSRESNHQELQQLMLKAKLDELEEMNFYKEKFSPEVLQRKIAHFCGNHVELFFEGRKIIDSYQIWEEIAKTIFTRPSKTPLFFVTTTSEGNGDYISFVPDPFELDIHSRTNLRTLIPIK